MPVTSEVTATEPELPDDDDDKKFIFDIVTQLTQFEDEQTSEQANPVEQDNVGKQEENQLTGLERQKDKSV